MIRRPHRDPSDSLGSGLADHLPDSDGTAAVVAAAGIRNLLDHSSQTAAVAVEAEEAAVTADSNTAVVVVGECCGSS